MKKDKTNNTITYALFWTILAICGVFVLKNLQDEKTEPKKHIETSLSGYIKQKQKIEHYRDSLMRVNGL